jgi:hypothetical protein
MTRFVPVKQCIFVATISVMVFTVATASAAVLFSDNFNTDTSGAWAKNAVPAANAATQTAEFAFDYAPFGIPPAPGSADTLGLRLRANVPIVGGNEVTTRPVGVLSGLSMSPAGQNFGANYKMTVYAWSNFFGAPNALGLADNAASEGGTANVLFAVGTSGSVPMAAGQPNAIAGSNIDGIAFATTGDGGIAADWRVYPKSSTVVPSTTPEVYEAAPAGSATASANTDPFYTAIFPTQTAPEVQQTIATNEFPGDAMNPMLGKMQAGSFGFAWHKVVVTKSGNLVTWEIDDVRIAKYDTSTLTLGGNNIALGVSDVNTSTARHPSLVFTLFDNLQVEDIAAVGVNADYNNNGVVDAADYAVWRNAGPTDVLPNDPTSGTVDGTDYDLWRSRFGATSGSGSAVPEPGGMLLLLLGICASMCGRRR